MSPSGLWEPLLLPALVLVSHQYLVVFARDSPFILFPGFQGRCLYSDSFLIAFSLPVISDKNSRCFLSPIDSISKDISTVLFIMARSFLSVASISQSARLVPTFAYRGCSPTDFCSPLILSPLSILRDSPRGH